MFRIAVFLSFLTVVGPPAAAADGALHVLKKRIVRSLAIDANDPSLVLVGQKAGSPGSALVFRSRDGGRTWRTLNGTRSLNPAATDVQAVLSVSPKILLAGTWKHGATRPPLSLKGMTRQTAPTSLIGNCMTMYPALPMC